MSSHAATAPARIRKKRRVFLWVFLAIQAIFVIWLIAGIASSGGPSAAAQAAHDCAGTGWQGLYSSHASCLRHETNLFSDASDVGNGIGIGLVIVLWMVVDVILGVSYGVYKLATRHQ